MIKAEANVIGTIKRSANIRTDKNNNPYLSFVMTVVLTDAKTTSKSIDVFVSLPNAKQDEAQSYVEGLRVAVNGNLDIRKKEDNLNFYLTGNTITAQNVAELDSISGTLLFRGYLKKENIYQQKTDKNNHPFIVFSAYSLEKNGQEYLSTWVNFMRFPEKGAAVESIIPDWMHSKAHVDITGELQVSAYNDVVRLLADEKDINISLSFRSDDRQSRKFFDK